MQQTVTTSGSIGHLWRIALPLMIGSLSAMAMMFVDRLMLARFTLEAHNAAVQATNLGWAFLAGLGTLAGVTQIFVAQNSGAGEQKQLGYPVWQMIWLSLFSCLLFWPLAYILPSLVFGHSPDMAIQRNYLCYMVLASPLQGLFAALCGFFIGQGKTRYTTFVVFIANAVNIGLCFALIFGIKGLVPSLGAIGAIIATNISLATQVVMLFCAFLLPKYRKAQGTGQYRLNIPLLFQCVRVGFPTALSCVLEIAGWALFYTMMSAMGEKHLTVVGIIQNVLILCFFFADGLARAVATIAGKAIGADHFQTVKDVVWSAFKLMTLFAVALALILWLAHPFILDWFFDALSPEQQRLYFAPLLFGLANTVVYKYLEGIRLVIGGALSAAADTFFLLVMGASGVWLFMVLPIYFFVVRKEGSVEMALTLCSFYTLMTAGLYSWRFYSEKWRNNASLVLYEG